MSGTVNRKWDTADGLRLRRAVDDAGISGRQFATRIGADKNTVSSWMQGRGNPTVQHLRCMAAELGVQEHHLLHDQPSSVDDDAHAAAAGGEASPSAAARDAAAQAADLLDRFDRVRADLAGVPDLLAALDSAQSAAQALRRAFGDIRSG